MIINMENQIGRVGSAWPSGPKVNSQNTPKAMKAISGHLIVEVFLKIHAKRAISSVNITTVHGTKGIMKKENPELMFSSINVKNTAASRNPPQGALEKKRASFSRCFAMKNSEMLMMSTSGMKPKTDICFFKIDSFYGFLSNTK